MSTQLNSVKMTACCVEITHVNSLSHVRLRSAWLGPARLVMPNCSPIIRKRFSVNVRMFLLNLVYC